MDYHPGELEIQRRAGVEAEAARVGRIVRGELPPAAGPFLGARRLLILGSRDERGRVWASLAAGKPGFAAVPHLSRLVIQGASPPAGEIGVLAIDFDGRQRMRINGEAVPTPGGVTVRVREAFPNCPKYIQRRTFVAELPLPPRPPLRSAGLSRPQALLIAEADTFFIASAARDGRVDASHRGGGRGFVALHGTDRIAFPDYPGNSMYTTMGNIVSDPRVGLLFMDFAGGAALRLTGRARVVWEPVRSTVVDIEEVVEEPSGNPLRWRLLEPSPFNPAPDL